MNQAWLAIGALVILVVSETGMAKEDALSRNSATIYISTQYGLTTHKSEMVNNNDTGSSLTYEIGVHAGSQRDIGISIRNDTSTIPFELNSSDITSTWQDFIIRYRLGYVYLGAVVSSAAMTATLGEAEEDNEIDAVSTGFGGHMATIIGIERDGAWYLDSIYNTYSETREANNIDMTIDSRMDVDTGVRYFITREVFDINFGYRYRTTGTSIGSSYTDTITSTYLGFRFNFIF